MSDIDEFFAEQDRRMGLPDEDVDEYIRARLEATQKKCVGMQAGDLLGDSSTVSFQSPQRDHEPRIVPDSKLSHDIQRHGPGFSENKSNREKRSLTGEAVRYVVPGVSSEPSSLGSKRRKTTHGHSIFKPALRTSIPSGRAPNSITSRTTQPRNGGSPVDLSPEHSSLNLVSTGLFPQHSRRNDQNNVSSSTDLVPKEDRDPTTWFAQSQTAQTPSRSLDLDGNRSSASRVLQTPPRGQFDTLPTLTHNRASSFNASSPAPVSLHTNASAPGSTALDGHSRDVVEFSEESHAGHGPPFASTAGIQHSTTARSPSRPGHDAHEARCAREYPAFRSPAGFHTEVRPDMSYITSPSYTPPRSSNAMAETSDTAVPDAQPPAVNTKEPKPRKTVGSTRKTRKSSTIVSDSKKLKEKPKLVTPLEYAQKLQSGLHISVRNEDKANHLHGKRIFYVGGDMLYASTRTRGRMEYIVKHGGTLVPKYDPSIVTHVVTDTTARPTLQALSLKSLSEIPDHIPTVKWSWVISGYGKTGKRKTITDIKGKGRAAENDNRDEDDLMDFEFLHAAFPERIDAGRKWQHARRDKQGGKGSRDHAGSPDDLSADISQISAFSQEAKPAEVDERGGSPFTVLPPPPLDFRPAGAHKAAEPEAQGKPSVTEDPLAEYYAQARAEREAQWSRDVSDSDDDVQEFEDHPGPVPRRGFACDMKGPSRQPGACVNQHIVDKLEELRELHKAKPSEEDRWRAYSYGKCIPALRNYPKPIRSFGEARSIRGVGEKTALKIMEIINTGDLRRIKYEHTDDIESTRIFQGIYGVGRQTAFAWFASGLRTLDDVRARKGGLKLSAVQEIGLKYYEEINSRMPRDEARRIFEMIKPIALAIDDKLFIEIMGSYRRGKADCGDIDILITRPTADGKSHQGILLALLAQLHTAGIITEDLAIPEDFSDLELIYRGLCKLPDPGAKRRRIDFLCVPWESRGAALLYYTGDDIFNRSMRLKANKHGYSLNQRGLYAGVVRDSHDRQKKTCEGSIIASETEEEIFKILGVPWQEPHERVRG